METRHANQPTGQTANEQFKRRFGHWYWGSVFAAVALHFALFAFLPSLQADDYSIDTEATLTIELPPEVDIPPPPEQIARPAMPVISEAVMDPEITMAPTTLDFGPLDELPPLPPSTSQRPSAAPSYIPFTEDPVLENRAEVEQLLKLEYPPLLRDAGLGGSAVIWFYIETDGRVANTQVKEPSAFKSLDDAALRVAEKMRFKPAKNRDQIVAVWVAIPITFRSGGQ